MHDKTLKEIVYELGKLLPERFLGRVFQLSAFSLAIDFGLKEHGYLFISVEPAGESQHQHHPHKSYPIFLAPRQ